MVWSAGALAVVSSGGGEVSAPSGGALPSVESLPGPPEVPLSVAAAVLASLDFLVVGFFMGLVVGAWVVDVLLAMNTAGNLLS